MIHYISWIWQSYWWKWFLNVAWVRLSVSLWFQNFLSKLCIPFASFFIHCYLFFAEFLVLKSQGDYSSVCTKNCKHIFLLPFFSSAQSLSHMWLCNPMDCSMPGFPVHHQLLQPAQTHVHWVGDAIQPSHPRLFPSPPTFNLSQHQSLFQRVNSSREVAKVLEFQAQHQYFQWIFRTDFL